MAKFVRRPIWQKKAWPAIALFKHAFLMSAGIGVFVLGMYEIPKMPRTVTFLWPAFIRLPDLVAFVFAMCGLSLVFVGDHIKRLDGYPKTRWSIALIFLGVGLGAVISNSVQKQEERNNSSAAEGEHRRAIGSLASLIKTQSEKADLRDAQIERLQLQLDGALAQLKKAAPKSFHEQILDLMQTLREFKVRIQTVEPGDRANLTKESRDDFWKTVYPSLVLVVRELREKKFIPEYSELTFLYDGLGNVGAGGRKRVDDMIDILRKVAADTK